MANYDTVFRYFGRDALLATFVRAQWLIYVILCSICDHGPSLATSTSAFRSRMIDRQVRSNFNILVLGFSSPHFCISSDWKLWDITQHFSAIPNLFTQLINTFFVANVCYFVILTKNKFISYRRLLCYSVLFIIVINSFFKNWKSISEAKLITIINKYNCLHIQLAVN